MEMNLNKEPNKRDSKPLSGAELKWVGCFFLLMGIPIVTGSLAALWTMRGLLGGMGVGLGAAIIIVAAFILEESSERSKGARK
jgi:hypothetical protein